MGNNRKRGAAARFARIVAFSAFAFVGCGPDQRHREVVERQAEHWNEVADILASIRDEPSVEAAEGKLAECSFRFQAIVRKAKALPKPDAEVRSALAVPLDKLQGAMNRTARETTRIKALAGGDALWKRIESSLGP